MVDIEQALLVLQEIKARIPKNAGSPKKTNNPHVFDFLNSIRKIPVLTPEQEHALLLLKGTHTEALDLLVTCNLRLVASVVKQVSNGNITMDYMQTGIMGLLAALKDFKLEKACRVTTYAVWRIRSEVERYRNTKERFIRLPNNKEEALAKVYKAMYKFLNNENTEPTPEQLAQATGLSLRKVQQLLELNKSFSAPQDLCEMPDNAQELGSSIVQQIYLDELTNTIRTVLKEAKCSSKGMYCFEQYYINPPSEDSTYDTIGKELGITREGVRQHLIKNLNILKNSTKLKEYVK